MSQDDGRQITQLGRGIVQINLKLGRITELLEATGTAPGAASDDGPTLEVLLDLLEVVERTLASLDPGRPTPWWRRWLDAQPPDLTGLMLARNHAIHQLERTGLQRAPTSGPADPDVHQILEVIPTSDPQLAGTIADTHRTGWFRPGSPPTVIRLAQVTAWRKQGGSR